MNKSWTIGKQSIADSKNTIFIIKNASINSDSFSFFLCGTNVYPIHDSSGTQEKELQSTKW